MCIYCRGNLLLSRCLAKITVYTYRDRLMEEIYEVRRWDGVRFHDIYTKFHKDLFRHKPILRKWLKRKADNVGIWSHDLQTVRPLGQNNTVHSHGAARCLGPHNPHFKPGSGPCVTPLSHHRYRSSLTPTPGMQATDDPKICMQYALNSWLSTMAVRNNAGIGEFQWSRCFLILIRK
jgi:hypothetical protein